MKEDFSQRIKKPKPGQRLYQDINFYKISDKIRLIADLTNGRFFTRQNKDKADCLKINEHIHKNRNTT
ncbi:hypothetical protein [Campylobacter sp. RM9328]|uniref:hypothetical protein n=1 Tax=Campylobacter sp. RM9328 TaxID=1705720 RepID=UPI0014757045|nr:hypothetical protein [Campylobacter sp. RM9328]